LGLPASYLASQNDKATWPARCTEMDAIFRTAPRDHWAALFAGSDACVAPVLTFSEAPKHPHMAARQVFQDANGVLQSAGAPRFSRSLPLQAHQPRAIGADTADVLREVGYSDAELKALLDQMPQ